MANEYPQPLEIERHSKESDKAYDDLAEIGLQQTSLAYPIRPGARAPEDLGIAANREPISEFLDRYIPDWSSLSYGDLIKEFNGIPITFEFVDSGDRKVTGDQVAEYIAGTKTAPENVYVRYFAPGTAAYKDVGQVIGDINREIATRTTYGQRQELIANRNPHILLWSNNQAKWYVARRQPGRIGAYVDLDANEILVYGTKSELEDILPDLNALPLYEDSFEGSRRIAGIEGAFIVPPGANVSNIRPARPQPSGPINPLTNRLVLNSKTGQWTDKLTGRVYPDPEPQDNKRFLEEHLTSIREHGDISYPVREAQEESYAHIESVSDFMDRYIRDWRDLTPKERSTEIDDLPIEIDGYETYEPEDAEFVTLWIRGNPTSVRGIRYYPKGSAAFTEPPHPLAVVQDVAKAVQSVGDIDLNLVKVESAFDSDEVSASQSPQSEPLVDFLDRYVPDWRELSPDELKEELRYLSRQFKFSIRRGLLDEGYRSHDIDNEQVFSGNTIWDSTIPGNEDKYNVRYYPRGVAGFVESHLGQVKFTKMAFSDDALDALLETTQLWEEQAAEIIRSTNDPAIRIRANFAANVAFIAAKSLQSGKADVLVAYSDSGIYGISVYKVYPDRTALISLVTVAPNLQPGTPGPKVKGIGTGMLCAVADDLVSRSVHQVCLKPLDDQAENFWRNRGFSPSGSQKLCVIDGIDKLAKACQKPEDPDKGDCIQCGDHEQVMAYTKPSVAAFLS